MTIQELIKLLDEFAQPNALVKTEAGDYGLMDVIGIRVDSNGVVIETGL